MSAGSGDARGQTQSDRVGAERDDWNRRARLVRGADRIAAERDDRVGTGKDQVLGQAWHCGSVANALVDDEIGALLEASFASSGTVVFRVISADAAVGSKSPSR